MSWDTGLNDALVSDPLFGQEAVHEPKSGSPQTLRAIQIDPFRLFDLSPDSYAAAWAPVSLFATPPSEGDGFTIASKDYVVFNVRRDAGGGVFLALSPAA